MDYYIDIQLRPSLEFEDPVLLNGIYFRLHKALGNVGQEKVGVSFPKFNKSLGSMLRLHSDKESLQRVMSTSWTTGIEDYMIVSEINMVPDIVSYRIVQRIQVKSSTERLLRRSVRKGWLTEEEAKLRLANCDDMKSTSLPYVRLRSLSSGQQFCLFIEHKPIVSTPSFGKFSAYGLSSTATVPWF